MSALAPALPPLAAPSLADLQALRARLVDRSPALLDRFGRAAAVLVAGVPVPAPDGLAWRVPSASDAGTTYTVAASSTGCPVGPCTCPDWPKAPKGWCKHRLAVAACLTVAAEACDLIERPARRPAPRPADELDDMIALYRNAAAAARGR